MITLDLSKKDFSKKDFSFREFVLDGHDELEISQMSLLLSSGKAGNETGLGVSQVWSAVAGLPHLHTHVHTHTHSATKSSET